MPESATLSAPSPSAAPVKPAGGAPSSPPPASTGDESVKISDNAFSELEQMDKADAPNTSRRRESKVAAPKPAETAPKRDESGRFKTGEDLLPDDEPEKDKKPEPTPETKPEKVPIRTADLRKAYDELKPRVKELESELTRTKTELEQAKSSAPDIKPLQTQLESLQKENATLKDEIRYANYQKHPEFLEKYRKPYEQAWQKAVAEVGQLTLEMEDGSSRKATPNDLLALANAPLDQLDELAEKWFPKSYPRVIRHVEKIKELADAQDNALEQARKGASEHETQVTKQTQERDAAIARAYADSQSELKQKYPRWFGEVEGDKDGNALLGKGYEYVDSVLGPNSTLNPEQKVQRLAVIRGKAANHDRVVTQLKSARTRITELEKELAEFHKSEPGGDEGGQPAGKGEKTFVQSAMDELDELNRRNA